MKYLSFIVYNYNNSFKRLNNDKSNFDSEFLRESETRSRLRWNSKLLSLIEIDRVFKVKLVLSMRYTRWFAWEKIITATLLMIALRFYLQTRLFTGIRNESTQFTYIVIYLLYSRLLITHLAFRVYATLTFVFVIDEAESELAVMDLI